MDKINIMDLLSDDSIVINHIVNDKKELLDFMVELSAKSGKITNIEATKKEIFEREKVMSTGVGKGLALPHAKSAFVTESVASFVLLKKPLDFDSLDKKPVKIVFMLIGNESNVSNHLRILSKISRLMNNDSFRNQLLNCENKSEVIELFLQANEM